MGPRCRTQLWVLLCSASLAGSGFSQPGSAASWEDRFSRGGREGVVVSRAAGGLLLAAQGENLLVDPGFDKPAAEVKQTRNPYGGLTHPTNGWERNGVAGREMEIVQAKLARSNGTAWELVDIMERGEPAILQRVPLKPDCRGKRFVFRVWARTRQGRNNRAMIAFKWRGKTHWRADRQRPITVGPRWQEYRIEDTMPADADQIGVVIGPFSYIGTGAIIVDDAWLGLAKYRSRGVYTSEIHDMAGDATRVWKVQWRANAPQGTSLALRVRTGPSPTPGKAWSPWDAIDGNPDVDLRLPPARYVQYEVTLATDSADMSPLLRSVQLSYGRCLGFVAGRVLHARTKAPVARAEVTVAGLRCSTGPDGRFFVGVPAGAHALGAECLHYLAAAPMPVAVHEGKQSAWDIKLKPDPNWWTFRRHSQRQAFSALSGRMDRWGVTWRYDLGRQRQGHVLVEDVNGDGVKEILVAAGGTLTARDLSGRALWEVKGWELGSVKGVYDLMGDGQKQVICVSAGWWPYANGAFTVIRGSDGKVLSRVDQWPDAGDIGHGLTHDHLHGSFSVLNPGAVVVADLDRDGKLEIAAHPNYHSSVLAYHFHDGLEHVKLMWKTLGRFKYDLYIYPLLGEDIDGDGKPEIVYHDHDMIKLFNGSDGTKKAEVNLGCRDGLYGAMASKDVDGDGRQEIFLIPRWSKRYKRHTVACAAWEGNGLVKRWIRDFAAAIRPSSSSSDALAALLANVDNDKALELTIQVGGDVRVLHAATGQDEYILANANLARVEDVDADGIGEITVKRDGRTMFFNAADGKLARRDLSYPADRRLTDWGDGKLRRWRWGSSGGVEIVNKAGKVTAALAAAPYTIVPIAADLEGDGKVEILVRDSASRIRVLDGSSRDGPRERAFPEIKCDRGGGVTRGGGITACDLDGDGKRELVFIRSGRLRVTDYRGQELFASKQAGLRHPAIGEFNRDGIRDIACYFPKHWIAFDWKHNKVIWQVEAPESNEAAAWDVDRDGLDELTGKHGPVFMLNGADGRTMWRAFRREMCALGLGTFGDLTGDGFMDVLITGEYTNTAWHANGENLWWIGWSSGGNKEHYAAVADVNGDAAMDVGLSSNHGVFYCVDGRDGRELWTYKIPRKVTLTHPAAADLDGDGKVEFVFGTMTGQLVVLNGEDGSVAKTMDFNHPVGAPVVADVDNDGDAEVLFVCNSFLCCVDNGSAAH